MLDLKGVSWPTKIVGLGEISFGKSEIKLKGEAWKFVVLFGDSDGMTLPTPSQCCKS